MDNQQKERLRYLAAKWLKRSLDQEEQEEFDSWISEVNDALILVPAEVAEDRESHKLALFNKIQAQIKLEEQRHTVRLWPKIAEVSRSKFGTWLIATAAAVVIVFGIWFFNDRELASSHAPRNDQRAENDIAPGRNGATITLANGKVIELSDQKKGVVIGGNLKYSDGTDVSSFSSSDEIGKPSEQLTASTSRGQTYQFTLPDGTRVWLNADSKISFPSQFNGKERKISLSGEAYFAVAHNAKQPFMVESSGQILEDIGTEFNINAYTDESSIRTTLVEGSASVARLASPEALTPISGREKAVILKPNQQSSLNANHIKVENVDTELAVAWKENQFIFERDDIRYIMRMISRWYNIEVEYKGELPATTFSGAVSRFANVSEVLRPLESTGQVKFKIEGRRIMVSQ